MLAFQISIFSSVDASANFCRLWKKGNTAAIADLRIFYL
jgi:hypothetical protein